MYVTDTHPLIYYATNQRKKLSKRVLQIFVDCEDEKVSIFLPAAVLWESSILVKLGKVKLKHESFEWWCDNLLCHPSFIFLPLELNI